MKERIIVKIIYQKFTTPQGMRESWGVVTRAKYVERFNEFSKRDTMMTYLEGLYG